MHLTVPLALVGALTVACSRAYLFDVPLGEDNSESGDTPPEDSNADAMVGFRCGPEPYAHVTLKVVSTSNTPLAGIQFRSDQCSDVTAVSDKDGLISGYVTKETPFVGRLEGKLYVPILTPEESFKADEITVSVPMFPTLLLSLLPDYKATAGALLVQLAHVDTATSPCAAQDGVSLSLKEQPDAKIVYYTSDVIPQPNGKTYTGDSGFASVTNLTPDGFVTPRGKKKNCLVSFKSSMNTGRAPLEAGWLTVIQGVVFNDPDAGALPLDAEPMDAGSLDGTVPKG